MRRQALIDEVLLRMTMLDDLTHLPHLLNEAKRIALAYLDNLDRRQVAWMDTIPTQLNAPLSEAGQGTLKTLEKFQTDILPRLSASSGPR